MEIDIISEIEEAIISDSCLKWFILILLKEENVPEDSEISILFTNNEKIKILNKQYRNMDKPTNVLSFSMREGVLVPFNNILGDVVISIEYAKEEAKKLNLPLEDRVVQLLIHGILHLLGYDHKEDDDYRKMLDKEELYYKLWKKEKEKCMKKT